jgi:hypothetical protein
VVVQAFLLLEMVALVAAELVQPAAQELTALPI